MWAEVGTKYSTNPPQVITKQEWLGGVLIQRHGKLRTACETVLETPSKTSCKPQEGHIHAELMAEYAEVAKTNPEPWKEFEKGILDDNGELEWVSMTLLDAFESWHKYRRKPSPPKTMNIGGIVVEAWPLGVGDSCTRLHTVRLNCNGYYVRSADANGNSLAILISSGRAFSTKEQAQAVADALNKLYNDALVGWKQQ